MSEIAESETCTIVLPVGRQGREPVDAVGGLRSVEGRTLAVLDISKVRSDAFADAVAEALRDAGAGDVERGIAPPSQRLGDAELSAIANRNEGAVLALADCGTCTSWTLYDAVELHRRGCRAVLVTTEALRPTVGALAPRLGLADLPIVAVGLPNREQDTDEVRATAAAAGPAILAALRGDPA